MKVRASVNGRLEGRRAGLIRFRVMVGVRVRVGVGVRVRVGVEG